MRKRLISEPLTPVVGGGNVGPVVPGAPLLPARFLWRGTEVAVAEELAEWRETGPCRHGSGERYVRKHWFRIRTAAGEEWELYFERQARSARELKLRWWLFTVAEP